MRASQQLLSLVLAGFIPFACLAQSWPAKPLRVIVASSAGGPPDTVTRGLVEPMRHELGQPLIVEDIPAADGIVAAQTVARAAPDGYTLLVGAASVITLNPVLHPKLPYDPRKDFAPVAMIAFFNSAFVVHPSVPVNTLRELIALAKSKPGAINFGTGGTSQTNNLYVEWFKNSQGIPFYNVPYKRNPPALQAVMAGEVHATTFSLGVAQRMAKAGKLKVLAVIGNKRVPAHPDVPALTEEGVEMVLLNWLGLFATAGTPAPVVQRVSAAVIQASRDRTYLDKVLPSQGLDAAGPELQAPEAFARFLETDLVNYTRVIREAKINPQ